MRIVNRCRRCFCPFLLGAVSPFFIYGILNSQNYIARNLTDRADGTYTSFVATNVLTDVPASDNITLSVPCDDEYMNKYRRMMPDSRLIVTKNMDIMQMKPLNFSKKFKNPCWYDAKGKLRCIPYMYLAGQGKCGTTDSFRRITMHPEFVSPIIKESTWLSSLRFRENASLLYYSHFFSPLSERLKKKGPSQGRLITGDASINTITGSHFWHRLGVNIGKSEPVENNPHYIRHMFKETKILINVRNPVERLWSEYLAFSREKVKTAEMFHELVVQAIDVFKRCLATRTLRACVYDRPLTICSMMRKEERDSNRLIERPKNIVMLIRGMYHVFIKDYMDVFPKQQILVQRLEDISANIENSLQKTFKFLGLRPLTPDELEPICKMRPRNPRRKGNRRLGSMLNSTRILLEDFYRPFNEELALLMRNTLYNYSSLS